MNFPPSDVTPIKVEAGIRARRLAGLENPIHRYECIPVPATKAKPRFVGRKLKCVVPGQNKNPVASQ
jgi:hypothetical protein